MLPDEDAQHAVLRRLDFLEQPASFFYDRGRPLRAADIADPYRRGILLSARATSRAERAWIRDVLDGAASTELAAATALGDEQ